MCFHVVLFHGFELTTGWKNSQCGQTAKARRGGKSYFLKKYQTPVEPIDNGTLDARTLAHNKELFDNFVDTRRRINSAIRALAGPGGNIIVPSEEFIEGNHYCEAAEFVEGVVPDDELEGVLAGLSLDAKKLLMLTAAGALGSVHNQGIVHSDLKLKNVLLFKNNMGNYVAKLIDFDSSYFVDEKPEEVVGTIDYYSPELGAYADAEDDEEREELGKNLTVKSDIFSLGLIFHFYLSGALPEPVRLTEFLQRRKNKGKVIYCWVALNSGCALELSDRITSEKYKSLIRDMLSKEPADRPSATEVLARLRAPEVVRPGDGPAPGPVTKPIPAGFCDPWSEHSIVLDVDKIKRLGFVSAEQAVRDGVKGYNFYKSDSTATFFNLKNLLGMNYAQMVHSPGATDPGEDMPWPEHDMPWPEHKIAFDPDGIRAKGFVKVERDTLNGIKGYRFTGSDGSSRFIRVEMVLNQKMAHKV